MTITKTADTSAPVHPLLRDRWSPRAFDPLHELPDDQLRTLLEAARWAPSASNTQPWRFLVTRRGEEAYARLFATLVPGNQRWAGRASALLLVAAQTLDEAGRERPWALYDTGQAVTSLVVQAQAEGLAVHQMGGFDSAAAAAEFRLTDDLRPVTVVAVGRADHSVELPAPLADRERAPRTRHPLDDLLLPVEPDPSADAAPRP
jgi:nitroreductase